MKKLKNNKIKWIFKSLFLGIFFGLCAFSIMNFSTLKNKINNVNFKNSVKKYQNAINTSSTNSLKNHQKSIEDYLKPAEIYEGFNINEKLDYYYLNETNNNIYMANKNGLHRLDLTSKKFVNVYSGKVHISFVYEVNSVIYVGSKEGLFTLNKHSKNLNQISTRDFSKIRLATSEDNVGNGTKTTFAIGKEGWFLVGSSALMQLSKVDAQGFYYSKGRVVYLGGKNGLYLFDNSKKKFNVIVNEDLALGFFKKIKGVFYSGGIHGFSKLNNKVKGKYTLDKIDQGNFQNGFIREIGADVYVGNKNGLFVLKNNVLEKISSENFQGGFIKEIKGNIYVSTFDKRILTFNSKNKKFSMLNIKKEWDFVKSINGVLVLGNKDGLFTLNKNGDLTKIYNSVGKGFIKLIEKTIYLGTDKGLFTYNLSSNAKNIFDNFKNNLKNIYSKSMVGGFVEKNNDFIYFSSAEKGLNIITVGQHIINILKDIDFVNGFIKIINNNIYIGKKDGLFIFNNSDNSLKKVLSLNLENGFMKKITNNIYIGSQKGLFTFDESSKELTKVINQDFKNGFIEEVEKKIYLGNKNGLIVYEPNDKTFSNLFKKDLRGGAAGKLNDLFFLITLKDGFFNISKKKNKSILVFDNEKFAQDVLYEKVDILELKKYSITMKDKEEKLENFLPVVSQSELIKKVKKAAPDFWIMFEVVNKGGTSILLKHPNALSFTKKSLEKPKTLVDGGLSKKPSFNGAQNGFLYVNVGAITATNTYANYLDNLKIKFKSKDISYNLKKQNMRSGGLKLYNLKSGESFDLIFAIKDPIKHYWRDSGDSLSESSKKFNGLINLDKLIDLPTSIYKINFKKSPKPNKFILEILGLKNIDKNLSFTYSIDEGKTKKQLNPSNNSEYKIELENNKKIQLYANPKNGYVWNNNGYNKKAHKINLDYPTFSFVSNTTKKEGNVLPKKEGNVLTKKEGNVLTKKEGNVSTGKDDAAKNNRVVSIAVPIASVVTLLLVVLFVLVKKKKINFRFKNK